VSSILELKGIIKRFPGVLALDNVQFSLNAGETHVVVGENGAGKSTLMKIINGLYQPDEGEILLEGRNVKLHSPRDALRLGISMIHQELSPVLDMTVGENIFIGCEPSRFGFVKKREMYKQGRDLLASLGIDIKPEKTMRELPVAQMQMVEIAKAISYNSKIIIMDEPTSAISDKEVGVLFQIIAALKEKNVGIIYISHKMDEIFRIADRITVMRDGKYIGTYPAGELDRNTLISLMVGRELNHLFPEKRSTPGEVILKVNNLGLQGFFENVSFELRRGEILGVAGLMGAGRSEMAETIFGIRQASAGEVVFNGRRGIFKNPAEAIKNRMAMITEDRKKTGLNTRTSVKKDMTIVRLKDFCRLGQFISTIRENAGADQGIRQLNIKTPSRNQIVNNLSGGNQQKLIIARWLMSEPELFIMDEPTRGIDVGAKYEIYSIICELASQDKAVLMISSELPEILGLCDRVVVMREGRMTGELDKDQISQEKIMSLATRHMEAI